MKLYLGFHEFYANITFWIPHALELRTLRSSFKVKILVQKI